MGGQLDTESYYIISIYLHIRIESPTLLSEEPI